MNVTDPVCGMSFAKEEAVATAEYEGDTFYFCSEECREEFETEPEDFVDQE